MHRFRVYLLPLPCMQTVDTLAITRVSHTLLNASKERLMSFRHMLQLLRKLRRLPALNCMQPQNIMGLYTPLAGPLRGAPGSMDEAELADSLGQPRSGGFKEIILYGNFVVLDLHWWRSEMVRERKSSKHVTCFLSMCRKF